jgi:hypothetical protein
MNEKQFNLFTIEARKSTQRKIEKSQMDFGIGSYERYKIDLQSAEIRFLDGEGTEKVFASLQVAGSWSPNSESWLWAWDNESVPPIAWEKMMEIQEFGKKNHLETVESSFEPCDEGEAWSMASIAAQILDAQCVYRVAGSKNTAFFLLFSIQHCP